MGGLGVGRRGQGEGWVAGSFQATLGRRGTGDLGDAFIRLASAAMGTPVGGKVVNAGGARKLLESKAGIGGVPEGAFVWAEEF